MKNHRRLTPPVISMPSPPRTRRDVRDFIRKSNLTFLYLFQESFPASGIDNASSELFSIFVHLHPFYRFKFMDGGLAFFLDRSSEQCIHNLILTKGQTNICCDPKINCTSSGTMVRGDYQSRSTWRHKILRLQPVPTKLTLWDEDNKATLKVITHVLAK